MICAANSAASFSASLDESPNINISTMSYDVLQHKNKNMFTLKLVSTFGATDILYDYSEKITKLETTS